MCNLFTCLFCELITGHIVWLVYVRILGIAYIRRWKNHLCYGYRNKYVPQSKLSLLILESPLIKSRQLGRLRHYRYGVRVKQQNAAELKVHVLLMSLYASSQHGQRNFQHTLNTSERSAAATINQTLCLFVWLLSVHLSSIVVCSLGVH